MYKTANGSFTCIFTTSSWEVRQGFMVVPPQQLLVSFLFPWNGIKNNMGFSMERNAILSTHSITIFNAIFSILMMLYIVMNTNGR